MNFLNISYTIIIITTIIFSTHEEEFKNKKIIPNTCERSVKQICKNNQSACYDIICGFDDFPFNNNFIRSITICNWPYKSFNLTVLKGLSQLEYLKITSKNITRLAENMPELNKLQIIELNNLSLHEINVEQWQNIANNTIQTLDLRGNQLEIINKTFIDSFRNLEQILLTGNNYVCTENILEQYEWILNNASKIADIQQISCGTNTSNLYYGKPLIPILNFIKAAKDECPIRCNCEVTYVMQHPETGLTPFIAVYCQNTGLNDLLSKFPTNTTILHLENNNITNLNALTENKIYKNVTDLYLDNNSISTLDVLEGADWLNKFRILSLRGNQLQFVKTYILENAFEKNIVTSRLHLGDNPWICECHFIPVFQELLRKYSAIITDDDITCSLEKNRRVIRVKVLSLSRSDLCKVSSTFKLEPLDILNIILASLIIIILANLAYDYYSFRNSGKLPWIVLKMP